MVGRRELQYSAVGLTDAFVLHVYGPPDAAEVLFFQAGFPDDHGAFTPLATELAAAGCLCAISCMPQYDRKVPLQRDGFDWAEVVEVIDAGVSALLAASQGGAKQVSLVIHDWGSFYGFMYANVHPDKVKRIASFDIAPDVPRKAVSADALRAVKKACPEMDPWLPVKVYRVLVQMNYQLFFSVCFAVGRRSPRLGNLLLALALALFVTPLKYLLSPVSPHDIQVRPRAEVVWHLCYPYFHLWRRIFTGKILKDPLIKMMRLPEGKPVLFLYGKDKNTFFHSVEALAKLDSTEGCRYRRLPGGHWVMQANHEESVRELRQFVGV